MPSAADWITLSEAAEILAAAPRRVRAEDIQPGLFEELDG
jgi:predicted metal-dependent hydrolase